MPKQPLAKKFLFGRLRGHAWLLSCTMKGTQLFSFAIDILSVEEMVITKSSGRMELGLGDMGLSVDLSCSPL